jgi:hypothetical protein
LQAYLTQREREVADEVRLAVTEARGRGPVVVLARERVQRWRLRVEELKEKSDRGMPVFAEFVGARQDWLKARGEMVKEWVTWRTALAKVRQAQGVLPMECGPCLTGAGTAPSPALCGMGRWPSGPP